MTSVADPRAGNNGSTPQTPQLSASAPSSASSSAGPSCTPPSSASPPASAEAVVGDDADHLHEECGIFGIFGEKEAANYAALGLHALQHRGQSGVGIVSFDGNQFNAERARGRVGDTFSKDSREDVMGRLKGWAAIGHNRYSTHGEVLLRNVQPLFADCAFGGLALAHNGNLTNAVGLREELVDRGQIFWSTTDTEVILQLIARSRRKTVVERMVDALQQVSGAFSLIALTKDALIGVRDPYGVRPLVLGRLPQDGAYILTSETCALDINSADYIRDVEPGELIVIDKDGISCRRPFESRPSRFCVFEYIYFSRPDSFINGQSVYEARKAIGAELAREEAVPADIIVPVPDSGVPAAIGYAQAAGIPFEQGIIRNHYTGRTFIEPASSIRLLGVKLKHNANRWLVKGKKVILVDDSIVRGTTSKKIVEMMRKAGAREVHMRVASPPTTHSCFYGIDTPDRKELLASRLDVDEMCRVIEADSLHFISQDGLYRAVGKESRCREQPQFCDACFTGDYPIALPDHVQQRHSRHLTQLAESA